MPAAAVIREGQALSGITGRIGFVDCLINYLINVKRNFLIAQMGQETFKSMIGYLQKCEDPK